MQQYQLDQSFREPLTYIRRVRDAAAPTRSVIPRTIELYSQMFAMQQHQLDQSYREPWTYIRRARDAAIPTRSVIPRTIELYSQSSRCSNTN
eukprot:g9916.t1